MVFWSLIFSGLLARSLIGAKWVKSRLPSTLLSGVNALIQELNDAWLNTSARTRTQRSIGLALVVMESNQSGSLEIHTSCAFSRHPNSYLPSPETCFRGVAYCLLTALAVTLLKYLLM
jgi:hypothetical protein